MSYITTNIRFDEEEYHRLKVEAARKRKSLSAIVREKVKTKEKVRTKKEAEKILAETRRIAKRNAKYLKGWGSVKALREIRYHGKW